MHHDNSSVHNAMNFALTICTAVFAWIFDISIDGMKVISFIDFMFGIFAKMVSFGSFAVLLILNYEKIFINIKKIFTKKVKPLK